jgi:predicted GNAT family acetyltransferase
MNEIKLKLNDKGQGAFVIEEGGEVVAEMQIVINKSDLVARHTEVSERLKGQGVGAKLLDTMVQYARDHQFKVVPLCPFVNLQFRRHPEKYDDVWNKNWHSNA